MQAVLYLLPLLATFAPTSATPTKALEKRASQCGQFETESTGTYTLGSDLWGEDEGTGSQCSSINGLNDGAVSWSTTWSWEDNTSNVKSYTNVVSSDTSCAQLSAIDSLPTTFDWRYVPPWNSRLPRPVTDKIPQLQRDRHPRQCRLRHFPRLLLLRHQRLRSHGLACRVWRRRPPQQFRLSSHPFRITDHRWRRMEPHHRHEHGRNVHRVQLRRPRDNQQLQWQPDGLLPLARDE